MQKPADTNALVDTIRGAWRKSIEVAKEFIRESTEEFDRSMMAAALAEGGMPEDAVEAMDAPSEPEPEVPSERSINVLLVDDEEEYIRTMAERMEMRDLGSDVALTGEQALTMLEGELPDVMVLDLKMPGMGGMEVLERAGERFPDLPIIILTGHGSDQEEVEARRLGAFDYLRKPIDLADLMEVIRQAHSSRTSQA
jgi:CheY-like chemotaxis protein